MCQWDYPVVPESVCSDSSGVIPPLVKGKQRRVGHMGGGSMESHIVEYLKDEGR